MTASVVTIVNFDFITNAEKSQNNSKVSWLLLKKQIIGIVKNADSKKRSKKK